MGPNEVDFFRVNKPDSSEQGSSFIKTTLCLWSNFVRGRDLHHRYEVAEDLDMPQYYTLPLLYGGLILGKKNYPIKSSESIKTNL